MTVTVVKTGPVFDGLAEKIIAAYLEHTKQVVGQEGVNRIHTRLGEVLQHPTGFYESNIHTDRQMNDVIITDTPVIYGPWLEGLGSRNQTTRFKGYFTFRYVTQGLNADVSGIAERELVGGGYLEALNGV